MAMKRLIALGALAVSGLTACPPPITPHPPPVYPISQCTEVFPDGYTRPVKTNHPWLLLSALPGVRVIRWLDRHCDKWVQGPYDPTNPWTACSYRPQEGDRYYSEIDGFVSYPPVGCPQPV